MDRTIAGICACSCSVPHVSAGYISGCGGTETVEVEVDYRQTEARSMLDEINEFRTGDDAWYWSEDNSEKVYAEGLGELTYDYELERIAMQRAAEIALSFSHTRPDGTKWSTLFDGYSSMGENLAAGYASAEDTFIQWAEEDEDYDGQGHRRNMLSENFTSVGIACVYYNGYYFWVQEFGSPASGAAFTEANDSTTTVEVDLLAEDIELQSIGYISEITVSVGKTVSLPKAFIDMRMPDTWPDNAYCCVYLTDYTWYLDDDDIYAEIEDNKVTGLKAGTTRIYLSVYDDIFSATLIVKEHAYGEPEFEWSDDYTSCTAVFICEDGDDTQEVECTVTFETIDPTCTEYGYILYAATVTFDGVIWGRYFRDAEVPATGHSYGEPVFTWASDYQSATASAACSSCGEELTAECQISGEVTAPSCTEDGSITYTATAVIDGTEYTDTRTGSGEPATGHAYLYTDNGDGTHTAVCYRGDGSFTEDHVYVDDGTCSLCGFEEHVHSYGKPMFSWSWSDTYTEVTAVFTCSCGDEQEIPCDVAAETTAPTCTEEGYILYTATVTFDGVTYTDTATEAGASATGHSYLYIDNGDGTHTGTCSICGDEVDESHTYVDGICVSCGAAEASHDHVYGDPEFTWSDDYSSCTAVFTCVYGDDIQKLECEVTSVDNGDGTITYNATVAFNGITYENALAEGETGETSDDSSGSGDDSTGEGSGGNGDTTADSTDSDSNGSISDDGGSQASGSDDADDQSSDSSSPASSGDSVQTGDDSNIAIWAGLAAAAGMLTILIGIRRKRRAY